VAQHLRVPGAIDSTSASLYLATPDEYVAYLRCLDDQYSVVMVVGHNPGLEDLLELDHWLVSEDADRCIGTVADVIYDGEILNNLVQQLHRIRASGKVVDYEQWQQQLRRKQPARRIVLPDLAPKTGQAPGIRDPEPVPFSEAKPEPKTGQAPGIHDPAPKTGQAPGIRDLEPVPFSDLEPVPFSERGLSPAEIYDRCRRSVVVIGQLYRDGTVTHAGGVVLTATGVIATAYHVLDKSSEIVSRGVRLPDGSVHPIVEILAADQCDDVALLQIAAEGLDFSPLSSGDVPGTPVTIISHPSGRFFTLSHGHIGRYAAVVMYGRSTIKMSVTAEFADGSSGSPVFNPQGEVAGLVSSTEPARDQMVFRTVVPAQTIRRMLGGE
jgi:phosphohistidine phosphatase SixA